MTEAVTTEEKKTTGVKHTRKFVAERTLSHHSGDGLRAHVKEQLRQKLFRDMSDAFMDGRIYVFMVLHEGEQEGSEGLSYGPCVRGTVFSLDALLVLAAADQAQIGELVNFSSIEAKPVTDIVRVPVMVEKNVEYRCFQLRTIWLRPEQEMDVWERVS